MITVRRMKEILKDLPDNYTLYGYEGEATGVGIRDAAGKYVGFIHAVDQDEEDTKVELHRDVVLLPDGRIALHPPRKP